MPGSVMSIRTKPRRRGPRRRARSAPRRVPDLQRLARGVHAWTRRGLVPRVPDASEDIDVNSQVAVSFVATEDVRTRYEPSRCRLRPDPSVLVATRSGLLRRRRAPTGPPRRLHSNAQVDGRRSSTLVVDRFERAGDDGVGEHRHRELGHELHLPLARSAAVGKPHAWTYAIAVAGNWITMNRPFWRGGLGLRVVDRQLGREREVERLRAGDRRRRAPTSTTRSRRSSRSRGAGSREPRRRRRRCPACGSGRSAPAAARRSRSTRSGSTTGRRIAGRRSSVDEVLVEQERRELAVRGHLEAVALRARRDRER